MTERATGWGRIGARKVEWTLVDAGGRGLGWVWGPHRGVEQSALLALHTIPIFCRYLASMFPFWLHKAT